MFGSFIGGAIVSLLLGFNTIGAANPDPVKGGGDFRRHLPGKARADRQKAGPEGLVEVEFSPHNSAMGLQKHSTSKQIHMVLLRYIQKV